MGYVNVHLALYSTQTMFVKTFVVMVEFSNHNVMMATLCQVMDAVPFANFKQTMVSIAQ
jgi:hypothetical protein